ncbi:hypothetical protein F5B20DRAFT_468547 [Whalleya microplaca]|nr:hypothetical protein F5B20DRAFT_468547 [Whalleya microplaca]
MANYNSATTSWGSTPTAGDDQGLQLRPMGLKVHYTFDKESQERCLARWPQILHVQTIPVDEQHSIGVINLKTCLQAVAQCSPELVGDSEKDYTVYAFDYSEPDTPLVGQGMFSWGLSQGTDPHSAQPQLIVGRITRNVLAIFGNGIRETLEVRLKLTAIPKIARNAPTPHPTFIAKQIPSLATSTSALSDNTEWNSFLQSNPNLGQQARGSTVHSSTIAPVPVRPFNSNYEARNDLASPGIPGSQGVPGSRSASTDPTPAGPYRPGSVQAPGAPGQQQGLTTGESASAPAPAKGGKPQSRPASRASSRGTGKPRGRPRKKPLPNEGSTSGYEDGTDADDGPRNKKRAKITKAERSNTATFGSAPESLRVAASTAGSIRNFRPVAVGGGDGPGGNHLHEGPRPPTPVPRRSGLSQTRPIAASNLRRASISGQAMDSSFSSSYLELDRSMSQSHDARSPTDSAAPSPSQTYSDGPSPADISSSPPVPRSALYSTRSSPAPSSPILPPMPMPMSQPDSGFMSGGLEDSRIEEDNASRFPTNVRSQAPIVAKPKPRRSRAKKQPAKPQQQDLVIHTETPGPPELLPQTSIYNPPSNSRHDTHASTTPRASEPPILPPVMRSELGAEPQAREDQAKAMSPENNTEGDTQRDLAGIKAIMMSGFRDDEQRQSMDSFCSGDQTFFAPAPAGEPSRHDGVQPSIETTNGPMEPPTLPNQEHNTSVEPELPAVPASDPVLPQLTFPMPLSEPMHPQTDAAGPSDGKSNKNAVKRQAIRQKLEEAIAGGQMPSFCRNCGALQTPTWRKIWRQEHKGVPAYHEYSEKPGHVTAINILERDDEGKPTLYEMIKKSLGTTDDKNNWSQILLCNPCGIWFSKFKGHRPPEKWEKDEQRLSQTRKKRANGSGPSRVKKSRTKSDAQSDAQMNLTSEACLPTDPLGPLDGSLSPQGTGVDTSNEAQQQGYASNNGSGKGRMPTNPDVRREGSTHSQGSTPSKGAGTPDSPITFDDGLRGTRRLLFPSPRKDGEQKILGELAVNIVHTSPEFNEAKGGEQETGKENGGPSSIQGPQSASDDFADLFGTPPRPSTPPPKTNSGSGSGSGSGGPFKTPTHPTPSHRPVTRSVTRSMRSVRSVTSPSQLLLRPERTPSQTPRSAVGGSGGGGAGSSIARLPSHLLLDDHVFGTPLSRSINQLLSEADHFVMPSPSRGHHLDLGELAHHHLLDSDVGVGGGSFDFGTLLSTDGVMPSSPPVLRNGGHGHGGHHMGFGGSLTYDDGASLWAQIDAGAGQGMGGIEERGDGAQ